MQNTFWLIRLEGDTYFKDAREVDGLGVFRSLVSTPHRGAARKFFSLEAARGVMSCLPEGWIVRLTCRKRTGAKKHPCGCEEKKDDVQGRVPT